MPKYGLLLSAGIDSRVVKHMYPDATTIHYQWPLEDGTMPSQPAEIDMVIDISSYSSKAAGMTAETISLLANTALAFDNIIYGIMEPYAELNDRIDAPEEGENTLIKPLETWYKHDIIRYAANNNIDLSDTLSCLRHNTHLGCYDSNVAELDPCYQCREVKKALDTLDAEGFDYTGVIPQRG